MRQFCARWWVTDPLAQWRLETGECASDTGIKLRFIRRATAGDVRQFVRWWEYRLDD